MSSSTRLTGSRLVSVLVLPWLFLGVFVWLVVTFLVPRVLAGHALAIVLGVLVATALVSFVLAAVTFSRDVLSGRYPASS